MPEADVDKDAKMFRQDVHMEMAAHAVVHKQIKPAEALKMDKSMKSED